MLYANKNNRKRFRLPVFLFLCFFVLILAGCGQKKETLMNRPAGDGNFHYQNKDLGFAVTLPPEFSHYQTQRKKSGDFIDLEFFVPTSDVDYRQEVPGYGKPIVVRIFKKEAWKKVGKTGEMSDYKKMGEKDGKVYAVKFWKKAPKDWNDKWTIEMKKKILEFFEIK